MSTRKITKALKSLRRTALRLCSATRTAHYHRISVPCLKPRMEEFFVAYDQAISEVWRLPDSRTIFRIRLVRQLDKLHRDTCYFRHPEGVILAEVEASIRLLGSLDWTATLFEIAMIQARGSRPWPAERLDSAGQTANLSRD